MSRRSPWSAVLPWITCSALSLTGGLVPAGAGPLPPVPEEIPLEDLVEVVVLDREVLAIDARGGGQIVERLALSESVLWTGSRGAVGVVLTTERVLAVGLVSDRWQEARYQRAETPPDSAQLGDRIAVVVTSNRVFGFDGGSGNLVEARLGLKENVVTSSVGANTAVVVTDRRALGLSPAAGGFFPVKVRPNERIESLKAKSNVATLRTDQRLLIFRSRTGTWEERILTVR